jgi:hypothetical protein
MGRIQLKEGVMRFLVITVLVGALLSVASFGAHAQDVETPPPADVEAARGADGPGVGGNWSEPTARYDSRAYEDDAAVLDREDRFDTPLVAPNNLAGTDDLLDGDRDTAELDDEDESSRDATALWNDDEGQWPMDFVAREGRVRSAA